MGEPNGYEITPQNIHKNYLNSDKWKSTIKEMRHKYLTEYIEIPIARRVERLKMLQEIKDKAIEDKLY
ncbi:MAG: DUF2280 domain-containing protein, partial [Candidatus Hodarchaeales archaeon]